jgi:hypothetical protein
MCVVWAYSLFSQDKIKKYCIYKRVNATALAGALHLTFRLYMTVWPAHKVMRSIAAGQNVPEKNPAKGAARLGFFGGRAAYRRRSIYSPVRRSIFCTIILPFLSIKIAT